MAELVEHRVDFVKSEQYRFAGRRFDDVDVVGHYRFGPEHPRLRDVAIHPGAALLVFARERIEQEQGQWRTILVEHFEHAYIFLVDRQIGAFLETQAI